MSKRTIPKKNIHQIIGHLRGLQLGLEFVDPKQINVKGAKGIIQDAIDFLEDLAGGK